MGIQKLRKFFNKKKGRKRIMDDNIEIIGIDHGWSSVKTAHTVIVSGVKEMTTEPALIDNLLEFDGKYYKVGGQRLEVRNTKVEDENYYLLTLAAIGAELRHRGKSRAKLVLSVGLPLTRFGAEKKDFVTYLSRRKQLNFKYEGRHYTVEIEKVMVSPQCYAAVVDRISTFKDNPMIIDIGSWTVDIMPIMKQLPDEARCKTLAKGLIKCIREINEELMRSQNGEAPEIYIQDVMINGTSDINEEYLAIIQDGLRKFAEKIYNTLKELDCNLSLMPIVFVGGGAVVMKNFGEYHGKNILFIEDIRANAMGYEYLANLRLYGGSRLVG